MSNEKKEIIGDVAPNAELGIELCLEHLEKKIDSLLLSPNFNDLVPGVSRDDEIDLRELWHVIWSGKWIVVGVTFVFVVASVLFALFQPNIYRSEVLLAPAEENSGGGLAGLAAQFGGLASFAGLNLGGGGGSDKTALALEVLKSREFITNFIEQHDLLVPLMAAEGWDAGSNRLMIDSSVYSEERKLWVRVVSSHKRARPSRLEAYAEFSKRLGVSQDKKTGFVTVSVEFYSPGLAKTWTEWLISDLNFVLKERDVKEAKRSIEYLKIQLESTPVNEMQKVFYQLIEEQTKTTMFAEVRDQYVFKTIDSAVVAELKIRPRRSIIVILGVFLGGGISLAFLLIRYFLVVKVRNPGAIGDITR